MAVEQKATPQLRVMWALHMARAHRHHPNCDCRAYGGVDCTAASALWTRALNRELEKLAETP